MSYSSPSGSVQRENSVSCIEDRLRRRLKYFFMDPCQKWKAKRKFPWKLVLQIVKIVLVTIQIVLVTIQLAMFGFYRAAHVNFIEKGNIAFKHLYLNGWDASYETMPYPPATGVFAIYTIPEFFRSVDYALSRYNLTEELAIGAYQFNNSDDSKPPVVMCKVYYRVGKIWAFNESYIYDSDHVEECINLEPVGNETSGQLIFDTRAYLDHIDKPINFDSIIRIVLKFSVKTVHLKGLTRDKPDCYLFNVMMLVTLKVADVPLQCHGTVRYQSNDEVETTAMSAFDTIIIIMSVLSVVLCSRSIVSAWLLRKDTVKFFKTYYEKELTVSDQMEFVNMWYVLIIINDVLTVAGSILKIRIENKTSHNYEVCGVLLGTGNLLVWLGVLRYLNFYDKYSILIMTVKRSIPNILRFLVCAAVFYFGFTVCGWVVLGPYHIKFRYFSTTCECLFSLINGDDMYNTFEAIGEENTYAWWYSRIYLYIFISFFIYVVLSVFISVIMDTYETIKHYCEHGFPRSYLEQFTDQCTDTPKSLFRSSSYSSQPDNSWRSTCGSCLHSCMPFLRRRRDSDFSNETDPLIS
ncbi:Mucolipin-3 [Lamellibrachia satsuma]|nr:Mucolipin-3 [Lamellibrachia satsuma]